MTSEKKIEQTRTCSFCGSEEYKPRMVGNFIVELTQVTIRNERKLACQSCRIKCREDIELRRELTKQKFREMGWLSRISNLF